MCVKQLPVEKSDLQGPLTTFRGPSVISSTPVLAVIYILQYDCCDKNHIVCVCPERPEFNVKHISSPCQ